VDLTGYLGLGRGLGLQRAMDVLSGNVANADSIGFRRQELIFEEDLRRSGEPGRIAFGQDRGTVIDHKEGALRSTGAMLDLALVGPGWFLVQTEDGERLTRAGRFSTNSDGQLVTSDAAAVLDQNGTPMALPDDVQTVSIATDGTVTADQVVVGRLGVVDAPADALLVPEGSGLYRTDAPLTNVADARVVQGSLEGSNVQPVLEMTRLIEVVRAFEGTQKLLETHHDLARRTVDRMLATQN
jgi:flagellar basal-body rod protein FlgF